MDGMKWMLGQVIFKNLMRYTIFVSKINGVNIDIFTLEKFKGLRFKGVIKMFSQISTWGKFYQRISLGKI